ncbi:MAG: polysaccharide deacetylase family protein [Nitrospirae bacterium]|nr:polysaccharide deacetylase family protein [Nitrospirota bacterium]
MAYASGLNRFMGTYGKNSVIFLMYHGIIKSRPHDSLKNHYGYNIEEKEFESQVQYLASHCNVIKASDALSGSNLSRNKKNVVITFDDGYRNNYTSAYSILTKYDLPALYSISTDFVADRIPLWNDVIEYAVMNTTKNTLKIKYDDSEYDFMLGTKDNKIKLYNWLLSNCIEIKQEMREGFVSDILKGLDVPVNNEKLLRDQDYEPMKPDDIRIMADSGMAEFASHSVHHYTLTNTTIETLLNEATESKNRIEELSGQQCKYFCIPGGHYNQQVTNAVFKAGYEKIFTSEVTEFDLMKKPDIIGRYCITGSVNMALFADMIQGPIHRLYYFIKSMG